MMLRTALISALMVMAFHAAQAADNTYKVLMSCIPKGGLEVGVNGDGVRVSIFRYEDRGRGPYLRTRSRFNAQRLLMELSVKGVNYMKRPVDERLLVEKGQASWTSAADTGKASGLGYYLPHQANAEDMAALLRAPQAELPLLPFGRASIQKILDYRPTAGANSTEAALYFISGITTVRLRM